MLKLLYNKKDSLLKELADLDLAKKPIEAKLAVIDELIKEEEAKPVEAPKAEATEQNNSTVFISYSNDLG